MDIYEWMGVFLLGYLSGLGLLGLVWVADKIADWWHFRKPNPMTDDEIIEWVNRTTPKHDDRYIQFLIDEEKKHEASRRHHKN